MDGVSQPQGLAPVGKPSGSGRACIDDRQSPLEKASSSKKRKQDSCGMGEPSQNSKQACREPSKEAGSQGDHPTCLLQGQEKKFHNVSLEDIIILEVCAGSARLTKTARGMGFKGVAIDHSDKQSCGVDICIFDLTDPAQLQDLLHS